VAALLVLVIVLVVEADADVARPTINSDANTALMRNKHSIFLMEQSSFLVFCYIALSLLETLSDESTMATLPGESTLAYIQELLLASSIESSKSSIGRKTKKSAMFCDTTPAPDHTHTRYLPREDDDTHP
jgi:hypothetical protein